MRLSFFEMLKWRTSGTLVADAGRDPGCAALCVPGYCRVSSLRDEGG